MGSKKSRPGLLVGRVHTGSGGLESAWNRFGFDPPVHTTLKTGFCIRPVLKVALASQVPTQYGHGNETRKAVAHSGQQATG